MLPCSYRKEVIFGTVHTSEPRQRVLFLPSPLPPRFCFRHFVYFVVNAGGSRESNIWTSRIIKLRPKRRRIPSAGQADRRHMQSGLQVLLFPVQRAALSGSRFRMSDEVLAAYVRQLLEAHQTPEVAIAWQGGSRL